MKKHQKYIYSNRQILYRNSLIARENLQLVQHPEHSVEQNRIISPKTDESASQADLLRKRAPTKCGWRGEIDHNINRCNKRQFEMNYYCFDGNLNQKF